MRYRYPFLQLNLLVTNDSDSAVCVGKQLVENGLRAVAENTRQTFSFGEQPRSVGSTAFAMVAPVAPVSHHYATVSSGAAAIQRDTERKGFETRTGPSAEPMASWGGRADEQSPSWRTINRLLGQAGFQALPLDAGLQSVPADASVRSAFAQVLAEYERRGQLLQSLLGDPSMGDDRVRAAEVALLELEQALLKSNRQIAWLKSKLLKYRAYIERKRRERREQQQQPTKQLQPADIGSCPVQQRRISEPDEPPCDAAEELRQLVADLQLMLHVPDYRLLPERIRALQRDAENTAWLAEFADCVRSIVEEVLGPEAHLSEEQVLDELERWAVERVSLASEQA